MNDRVEPGSERGAGTAGQPPASPRPVSPAARRALAEAAERRAAQIEREKALATGAEHRGRGGPDPVRYSDWEVKGLATDF